MVFIYVHKLSFVQVADFGLAKFSSDANTHVSTRVMGTFGYVSYFPSFNPERILSKLFIPFWSLCCVINLVGLSYLQIHGS